MNYFLLFLAVFSIWIPVNCLDEGDICRTNNGRSGVCKSFGTCPKVITDLNRRINPTICSFVGRDTIVCCPDDGAVERTTSTTTTSTTRRPITYTTVKQCEFPESAIRVQRNNQKAWDKCIDLADNIWPCKRLTGLGSPLQRHDTCEYTAKELVLGGIATGKNEFPHMVVLGFDNAEFGTTEWDCGGTLISEEWVLTAAHCLWHKTFGDVKYARLGGRDLNIAPEPKFLYTISKIEKHPDYTISRTYNDIALVKLDRKIKYSNEMRPACLHTGNLVKDQRAIAIGYGATENARKKSNVLLKVILDKFTNEECNEKHPPLRKSPDGVRNATQVCYGSDDVNKDTCQGDSGGPIQIYNPSVYCTYLIVGVTSVGKNCGVARHPGIYTRVSAYIPWIESVVWP